MSKLMYSVTVKLSEASPEAVKQTIKEYRNFIIQLEKTGEANNLIPFLHQKIANLYFLIKEHKKALKEVTKAFHISSLSDEITESQMLGMSIDGATYMLAHNDDLNMISDVE